MAPKRPHTPAASHLMNPTSNAPSTATSTNISLPDTDADAIPPPTAPSTDPTSKKRKKKDNHILHTTTFRKPLWSYLHLQLLVPTLLTPTPANNPPKTPPIDPLTTSTLLTTALTSFLGLTGSSIPLDILHISGVTVYIRIPRQDTRAVRGALAGWVGNCEGELLPGVGRSEGVDKWGRVRVAWRIVGEGECLGSLGGEGVGGDGREMFGG